MISSSRLSLHNTSNLPTTLLLKKSWPPALSDEYASSSIDELSPTYEEIKRQVENVGDILIRIVTWNQQAREPPSPEDLAKHLFQSRRYHIIVVGTQECENTFAKSILNPSKAKWEERLEAALGTDFDAVHSHSLQASHIIIFAHKAIAHWVSNIRSVAIPTGIGDKLGNKGGIGMSMNVADSSFCFINVHLAAHQHATNRRTSEFKKISNEMVTKMCNRQPSLSQTSVSSHSVDELECVNFEENLMDDGDILPNPSHIHSNLRCDDDMRTDAGPTTNPLIDAYDYVFYFGDLNFRINGTREVVDGMLENHMHDALLCNDQLTMLMRFNRIFSGFGEGPLNFFPTYKFDNNSDHYDSSQRRRVPSWTDRILFKKDSRTQILSYCSSAIRTSDHRPVYATFRCRLDFDDGSKVYDKPCWELRRETRSE
ncbi:hypothetical protein HJC23_010316, partial [Cyclotella cryptica]